MVELNYQVINQNFALFSYDYWGCWRRWLTFFLEYCDIYEILHINSFIDEVVERLSKTHRRALVNHKKREILTDEEGFGKVYCLHFKGGSRHKNWCMAWVLNFLIRYFSNYYLLHRSDLAAWAAPLDPRLLLISLCDLNMYRNEYF